MLQGIRTKTSSWVVKILFVFLVASFAVWGVGDIVRVGFGSSDYIEVSGRAIPPQQIVNEFRGEVDRLQSTFGGQLTAEMALQIGVLDGVVQNIVSRSLYDQAAVDAGLLVDDDRIRDEIMGDPRFQVGTQFDRTLFERTLQSLGMSEEGYIAALRGDVTRQQLVAAVVAGAPLPEDAVTALYRYREERRRVAALVVLAASITDVPAPADADVQAYYESHPEDFTAPEYRRIVAVHLDPAKIAATITVSEEKLREDYAVRLAELTTPERRTVEQMVLPDQASADRAAALLAEGRAFADVAADIAGLGAEQIALGAVTREDLVLPELGDAVFALGAGGVSPPVQSPLGWHLFRVVTIEPMREPTFEEARAQLTALIAADMAADEVYALGTRLEDALAGGLLLRDAASSLGLEPITIEAIDAQGLDPQGVAVTGYPGGEEFLSTAFSLEEGQESGLMTGVDGSDFVLQVDAITPAAVRPLDAVRDAVIEAWTAQQRDDRARTRATELAERIGAGEAIAAVAAASGLEVLAPEPFNRFDGDPGGVLGPEVVESVFTLAPGAATLGATAGRDGYAVARLIEVVPADASADPEGVAALSEQLYARVRSDLLSTYAQALSVEYAVTINRDAIAALFSR